MLSGVVLIVVSLAISSCPSEGRTISLQKRAAFYIANETACVVDNTVYYNGDPIPTDDPCEACKCRPPGFACVLRECEVKPGCRAVRRVGHCCPEYVCGCEHNGRMYRDGDEIRDTQNPCYTCHCQGSAIACAFVDCFFRVDCPPEYKPGECCPRYDHCPAIVSATDGPLYTSDPEHSEPLATDGAVDDEQSSSTLAPIKHVSEGTQPPPSLELDLYGGAPDNLNEEHGKLPDQEQTLEEKKEETEEKQEEKQDQPSVTESEVPQSVKENDPPEHRENEDQLSNVEKEANQDDVRLDDLTTSEPHTEQQADTESHTTLNSRDIFDLPSDLTEGKAEEYHDSQPGKDVEIDLKSENDAHIDTPSESSFTIFKENETVTSNLPETDEESVKDNIQLKSDDKENIPEGTITTSSSQSSTSTISEKNEEQEISETNEIQGRNEPIIDSLTQTTQTAGTDDCTEEPKTTDEPSNEALLKNNDESSEHIQVQDNTKELTDPPAAEAPIEEIKGLPKDDNPGEVVDKAPTTIAISEDKEIPEQDSSSPSTSQSTTFVPIPILYIDDKIEVSEKSEEKENFEPANLSNEATFDPSSSSETHSSTTDVNITPESSEQPLYNDSNLPKDSPEDSGHVEDIPKDSPEDSGHVEETESKEPIKSSEDDTVSDEGMQNDDVLEARESEAKENSEKDTLKDETEHNLKDETEHKEDDSKDVKETGTSSESNDKSEGEQEISQPQLFNDEAQGREDEENEENSDKTSDSEESLQLHTESTPVATDFDQSSSPGENQEPSEDIEGRENIDEDSKFPNEDDELKKKDAGGEKQQETPIEPIITTDTSPKSETYQTDDTEKTLPSEEIKHESRSESEKDSDNGDDEEKQVTASSTISDVETSPATVDTK